VESTSAQPESPDSPPSESTTPASTVGSAAKAPAKTTSQRKPPVRRTPVPKTAPAKAKEPAAEDLTVEEPAVAEPAVEDSKAEEAKVDELAVEAPPAAEPELAPEESPAVVVTKATTQAESPVIAKPMAVPPIAKKPASVGKAAAASDPSIVLSIVGLVKRFGDTTAVAGIDLDIRAGSFFGIVGPNGAGKTTTLSMVTGLLRPDAGRVSVHGSDVWKNPAAAKRNMGVLPDRLRLFDRLTGAQLLYYSGILRGLDRETVKARTADLADAFGFEDALNRLVTDYSAGMSKKIALAAAMIHSPRLLVLDEPFESVDPVSAANVTQILRKYVAAGGTVVLSSHSMDLIQRICDYVAVVVNGSVLDTGTMDEVRKGKSLEERFVELAGGRKNAEGMEWLHSFSN
jgi:ABC-type multidrug transport system ATPase subunit